MQTNTIVIAVSALIIGLVLGYTAIPSMLPYGAMMGDGMRGGMQAQNIDQHFIEQMIPHHEGAIAMAEMALEQSTRAEVRSLAEDIIEAQTREINDMTEWYTEWFGKAPAGVGHGGMHMEGMEGDLDKLEAASNFDREFVSQMVVHHEMAVMMARMLEVGTERPEMQQLAQNIIESQTQEIDMMRGWLASW